MTVCQEVSAAVCQAEAEAEVSQEAVSVEDNPRVHQVERAATQFRADQKHHQMASRASDHRLVQVATCSLVTITKVIGC